MTPQQKAAQHKAILEATAEYETLAMRQQLSQQEKRRLKALELRISTLKAGVPLHEVDLQEHNEIAARNGLAPITMFPEAQSAEDRRLHEFIFKGTVDGKAPQAPEFRFEGVTPPPFVNLNGAQGSFVPVEFLRGVISALKQHSPLFDPQNVNYLQTNHGRPIQVPYISDIENVAAVITENTTDTEVDIFSVSGLQNQVYCYRTPMIQMSYEAFQDVDNWKDLFEFVLADRIARGAGADLMTSSSGGIGKTQGLIPTIQGLGATIVAAGSSVNDGSSNTAVNSIGVQDLANLYFKVPHPYRMSPKFAFMMNSNTMLFISKLLDKSGRPLLDQQHDQFKLYNRPVLIDESIPNIGSSAIPVLAGDFSRWFTRVAFDEATRLVRYTEAPGLVENGLFGLRMFVRVGGNLLHDSADVNAPSPIWGLQNHS